MFRKLLSSISRSRNAPESNSIRSMRRELDALLTDPAVADFVEKMKSIQRSIVVEILPHCLDNDPIEYVTFLGAAVTMPQCILIGVVPDEVPKGHPATDSWSVAYLWCVAESSAETIQLTDGALIVKAALALFQTTFGVALGNELCRGAPQLLEDVMVVEIRQIARDDVARMLRSSGEVGATSWVSHVRAIT